MKGIIARFLGCVLAMPIAAAALPGVHTASGEAAWLAGLLLGVAYLLLRPLVRLLLSPLNCLTLGLIGFVFDVALIQFVADQTVGFRVDSFLWAVAASLVVSICREAMGALFKKEDR